VSRKRKQPWCKQSATLCKQHITSDASRAQECVQTLFAVRCGATSRADKEYRSAGPTSLNEVREATNGVRIRKRLTENCDVADQSGNAPMAGSKGKSNSLRKRIVTNTSPIPQPSVQSTQEPRNLSRCLLSVITVGAATVINAFERSDEGNFSPVGEGYFHDDLIVSACCLSLMEGEANAFLQREQLVKYFRIYHVPGFLAGVFLILLLVVLHRGLQSTLALSLFAEELLSPFRTGLIGLGTGYYLGEALNDKHSSIVAFHVGAFSTLLVLSISSIAFLGNSTYILIISVLFALFMNISELIEYAGIRSAFDGIARDGSRSLLVVITALQYTVSFFGWSEAKLANLSLVDKGIVVIAIAGATYIAYAATKVVNTKAEESANS